MSSTPSNKSTSGVDAFSPPSLSSRASSQFSPSPSQQRKSMMGNGSNSGVSGGKLNRQRSRSRDEHEDTSAASPFPPTHQQSRLFVRDVEEHEDEDEEDDDDEQTGTGKNKKKNKQNKGKKQLTGGGDFQQLLYEIERAEDEKKQEKAWQEREQAKEQIFQETLEQTRLNRYDLQQQWLKEHNIQFKMKVDYDFKKSTEDHYAVRDPALLNQHTGVSAWLTGGGKKTSTFVGKYQEYRSKLDYSYHSYYFHDRQLLQDQIIDYFLDKAKELDDGTQIHVESPLEHWIVFTAGTMGTGKAHTMKWLGKNELFPFETFFNINPEEIRKFLPETSEYNRLDDNKTLTLTQKEVCYIAEILTLDALDKHRNVLIDASLRTTSGYLQYFKELRASYPILKIAMICVESNVFTILERAKQRALVTGRLVPEKFIINSLKEIVHSMNTLTPYLDFYAKMVNEDNSDPMLAHCELHFREELSQTSQQETQDEDTGNEGEIPPSPPLDSSPNESSGNRKKIGRKKVQEEVKIEWVLRQKDLSLEMMSALSSSTLTMPSSSALDTTGLLDPVPIATHTLTTIKRKKGQEFVKSGNGSNAAESGGTVVGRVRSTSGNVEDFEMDGNHETNRKHSISLATRILNRKDDFGTASPSVSNNGRKKMKSNAKSSSSQLTTTEVEEGILEKKVKEVFDWRPHFKEVWQLRCELSSYYRDRLRRLTAMKQNQNQQQSSQLHAHEVNNGSDGLVAVVEKDKEKEKDKDRVKDQLATDRTHQVDGEDHQAAFADRGHVVDPASSGWFCLPFFFKASPSASSNTGTSTSTATTVAVPLVSSPYAKINPELATTSTEETVKVTSE